MPECDPLLWEIVERLTAVLNPGRINLFASRARGEVGPDSNYDVLVLVEGASDALYRLSEKGFRDQRATPAALDVLDRDRATFDSRRYLKTSFPAAVLREEQLLHAA
ncbi:MAG: nucleotidyltransferase domain-containing protein [Bryobacterales bacterium]|nr:nucleotidyltransferase domain-containing protein [Bryobacterales bacterium]